MFEHPDEPIGFTAEDALRDPTRMPGEFRAWIVRWLEASDMQTPSSQIVGPGFVPVGGIVEWETDTPPPGWLILDGSAVSRTNYPKLFELWGTTFGVGDGSTTFNVQNREGRFSVGVDSSVSAIDTVGKTGGSAVIGTANLPAHTHAIDHGHTMTNEDSLYTSTGTPTGFADAVGAGHNLRLVTPNVDNLVQSSGSTGSGTDYRPPFVASHFIVRAV